MPELQLTPDGIGRIIRGETDFNPVLQVKLAKTIACAELVVIDLRTHVQVANLKRFGGDSGSERWRLTLSDGKLLANGMLATQLNSMVHSPEIQVGTLIQLDEFVCNRVQNKR